MVEGGTEHPFDANVLLMFSVHFGQQLLMGGDKGLLVQLASVPERRCHVVDSCHHYHCRGGARG